MALRAPRGQMPGDATTAMRWHRRGAARSLSGRSTRPNEGGEQSVASEPGVGPAPVFEVLGRPFAERTPAADSAGLDARIHFFSSLLVIRAFLPPALLALFLFSVSCATAPPPVALRDRFPLDPREGLAGPFPPEVGAGWAALLAGDAAGARVHFSRVQPPEPRQAARIGLIETLVADASLPEAIAACGELLSAGDPTTPLLVACGEAHARSGQALPAWNLYRQAVARARGRAGLEVRAAELRTLARDGQQREAREAAVRKDWNTARQAADRSIEIDPESAPARETAGDVALESGNRPAALARYREGLDLSPRDRTLREKTARLALELKDYATAIPILDRLAAEDPRFEAQAENARFAFRVANWPAAERTAARAGKLTRGEAARLLWWMVPEVREAKVTEGVIASDVVGRPDRLEISRAVSLGLLDADRETHRADPDALLTFSSAARLYLRVLAFLRPAELPNCAAGRPVEALSNGEAIRVARECRIVRGTEGTPVGGASFTRAIDRVRALAAKGENEQDVNEENERPEE
jgi:tetratricopeptide (TPR) repeat protein